MGSHWHTVVVFAVSEDCSSGELCENVVQAASGKQVPVLVFQQRLGTEISFFTLVVPQTIKAPQN